MEVAPFFVNFHHFLSIFMIYALLSLFTFCRDLRTFPANFFGQNSLTATSHVFCMYARTMISRRECVEKLANHRSSRWLLHYYILRWKCVKKFANHLYWEVIRTITLGKTLRVVPNTTKRLSANLKKHSFSILSKKIQTLTSNTF